LISPQGKLQDPNQGLGCKSVYESSVNKGQLGEAHFTKPTFARRPQVEQGTVTWQGGIKWQGSLVHGDKGSLPSWGRAVAGLSGALSGQVEVLPRLAVPRGQLFVIRSL
jgi:hypothetical protein